MGTATESSVDARLPQHFLAGDGLRAIACMAIVVFHLSVGSALRYGDFSLRFGHSYGDVPGGLLISLRTAVTVFFALSGYLVGGPFVRAWIEGRRLPDFAKYAQRRLRRIGPAFWLVLVYLLLRHGASGASAAQIAGMFGFQHIYFGAGFPFVKYIQQLWTVDDDMYFYFAAPLLAAILVWLTGHRVLPAATEHSRRRLAVVGLVISALASAWLEGRVDTEGAVGKSLLGWWVAFAPGIALAAVEVPARVRLPGTRLGRGLAWGALGISLLSLITLGRAAPTSYHLAALANSLAGSFLVVAAMLWQWTTGGVWRVLVTPPLRALGRWSFGIYLWHIAVIYELFQIVGPHRFSPAGQIGLLLIPTWAVSIALGALSWHFIEEPITKRAKTPVPREASVLA